MSNAGAGDDGVEVILLRSFLQTRSIASARLRWRRRSRVVDEDGVAAGARMAGREGSSSRNDELAGPTGHAGIVRERSG